MFSAYVIFALSAFSYVSAAPSNASLADTAASNVTQLPIYNQQKLGIDPRFGMQIRQGYDDLNEISCYMNAIRFLGYEALQAWEESTEPSRIRQPPWDDVVIAAAPLRSGLIPRKFVVWGLYESIVALAGSAFKNTAFYLLYDRVQVGVITVDRPRLTNDKDSPTIIPTHLATLDGYNDDQKANDHGPEVNPARTIVEPAYLPNGRTVLKKQIYLALASALANIAEVDSQKALIQFTLADPENQWQIAFDPAPGRRPVAMKFADAVTAVWDLAKYVTSQNRYAEIKASVKVGGSLAGTVTITKYTPPSEGTSSPGPLTELAHSPSEGTSPEPSAELVHSLWNLTIES